MIEAILQGILAGIIFSFLTGPVFFSMIKTSIEKGFKAGFALATGVIISDIILITLTLFSTSIVEINSSYNQYIGLAGGCFLLGVGLYYLIKRINVSYNVGEETKVRRRGYILKGFLMCILSPTTYMFWLIVGGIVSTQFDYNVEEKIIFLIAAMSAQFSVDTLKVYYTSKLRHKINENTIRLLNRVAGAVIVVFSLRIFFQLFTKYWYF